MFDVFEYFMNMSEFTEDINIFVCVRMLSSTLPVSTSVSVVAWFPWSSVCVFYEQYRKEIFGGGQGSKGTYPLKPKEPESGLKI